MNTNAIVETPGNPGPINLSLSWGMIKENSAVDTKIGVFSATDPDGDALTYELLDNAGGRFKIVGDALYVASSAGLDYEQSDFHNIQVRVTDSDGASSDGTFGIKVTDAPEGGSNTAPRGTLTGHGVAENSATGTEVGSFMTIDLEEHPVTIRLVDNAGGRYKLVGNNIFVGNGAKLDFEAAHSHDITIQLTDSLGATRLETYTLGVRDVAEEVFSGTHSHDVIMGGKRSDRLSGGKGNDKLDGGAGNDRISGDAGRDVVSGGLGKDLLSGGQGVDAFLFSTKAGTANLDRITDFSVKDDSIQLAKSVFAQIGAKGALSKDAFWAGSGAQDADDRILYNAKNGVLSYDADGSGSGKALVLSTLAKNLKMTAGDFFVI